MFNLCGWNALDVDGAVWGDTVRSRDGKVRQADMSLSVRICRGTMTTVDFRGGFCRGGPHDNNDYD